MPNGEFKPLRKTVFWSAEAGQIRLSVKDNGEGISAEMLPKVFDRFFRGDPARTKADGSGLGLSMVAAVMKLHLGQASIQSNLGQGTAVHLDFPGPGV